MNATVLFGAAEVVVPRGWNVQFDVLPVLGAAEDGRPRVETDHDETDLIVTGTVAFDEIAIED